MKSLSVTIIALLMTVLSYGQTIEEAKKILSQINNVGQIDCMRAENPKWNIFIERTSFSDTASFSSKILRAKPGEIVVQESKLASSFDIYKIIEDKEVEMCRVQHIYLNGAIQTKSAIDSIRSLILKRYAQGDDFETLVKAYSNYTKPTGDLGWFDQWTMVPEFNDAIWHRNKGDIFTVDIPKHNWYYVILKAHDNKMEKARISIQIRPKR